MINSDEKKSFFPEIQGLRAVAVVGVLLFHIWPGVLPGGYVGVDVFFVISGYLITGLLLREAQAFGRISLANFYARRIRRLLPAAILVITVSILFVWLLPQVQWIDTAKEAVASTLYIQNWWLAHQSVDYLAQDSAAGLFRHYWSLSVEEQYYILWPLMFLFVCLCRPALKQHPERAFILLATSIGIVSLAYSIYITTDNPPLAYFATTTRAWELAIGSGLAVVLPRLTGLSVKTRGFIGWLGLGFIGLACLFFDESTSFPGFSALLPTLGAAFVIVAGQVPSAYAADRILRPRLMQYLGNISYSLYLWHWPVLIFYYSLLPSAKNNWFHGLFILAIAVTLAHFTRVWIEEPFRRGNWRYWPSMNSPAAMMVTSFLVVLILLTGIFWQEMKLKNHQFSNLPVSHELLNRPYSPDMSTIPPLDLAAKDNPDVYRLGCHVNQRSSEPKFCNFGKESAKYKVVLIGDSHAANWLPTLQEIYRTEPDWRILTFTKSACAFNSATVTIGKDKQPYTSCAEWNKRVLDELKVIQPQLVIVTSSVGYGVYGVENEKQNLEALVDGLLVRWEQLLKVGARVVVIRDTPRMKQNIPECMSALNASVDECSFPLAEVLRTDPIVIANQRKPEHWTNLDYIDMNQHICEFEVCKPVSGQVLIWRDSHHLTATYARSLADEMKRFLLNK